MRRRFQCGGGKSSYASKSDSVSSSTLATLGQHAKKPVAMRLFKTFGDLLERWDKDDTMAAYAKDAYMLHVLKTRQLLAVDGAKALGPEATFDARM